MEQERLDTMETSVDNRAWGLFSLPGTRNTGGGGDATLSYATRRNGNVETERAMDMAQLRQGCVADRGGGLHWCCSERYRLRLERPSPRTKRLPTAFDGLTLPYAGPGAVWVLDDGSVVVQVGRLTEPVAHPGTSGVIAVGGAIGGEGHGVKMFLLDLSSEKLALTGDGHTWALQPEQKKLSAPRVIPVTPVEDGQCGCHSLLTSAGNCASKRIPSKALSH